MKIHVQCARNFRKDFINVDSRPHLIKEIPEGMKFCQGSINNFDNICKDGEAEIISMGDRLETLGPSEVHNTLKYWSKKLSPKGTIEFFFSDIGKFSNEVLKNPLPSENVNYILYGEPGLELRMIIDVPTITNTLDSLGFIVKKSGKFNDFLFKMTFVRKENV